MATQAEIDEFWKVHYQERLALMEAEIAALKLFIRATFNRPDFSVSLHPGKTSANIRQGQAAYDQLFPPEGIVKRAGRDPQRRHEITVTNQGNSSSRLDGDDSGKLLQRRDG